MRTKVEPGHASLTLVLILAMGTFATGTDAFIIAGVLPAVADSLHSSLAVAGQMVTVFALGYALGSPLTMATTAHWPRRPVLIGSMVLFALANVISATSPNLATLTASRILAAVLAGLFVPSATATAAVLVSPEKRGRALAVVLGGTSLSTVLGVPIGLYISEVTSWRGAFLFVAALSLLSATSIAILLPGIGAVPKVSLRDRAAMLRRVDVLSVLLITICANAGAFSVYTYLAVVFQGLGGTGLLQILIFSFGVAALSGSYLSGHGADKWGAVRVLTVVLIIFTVNHFLLAFWAQTVATAILYMVVWGLAGWGTVPPQQHRLVQMAGPAAGIAISLNASALYLGIGLGGIIGGYVVETGRAAHLGAVAGLLGAVALLLVPLSVALQRRGDIARASQVPAAYPSTS